MKEEEIIKFCEGRINDWFTNGADRMFAKKGIETAIQSYKDWLWGEIEKRKEKNSNLDEFLYEERRHKIHNFALSEIQSLIKPEKK